MLESTSAFCLAFDLSTVGSQIGLLRESDKKVFHFSKFDHSFGSMIGDRVSQILKEEGIARSHVKKVLVQTGPGSFTGIKVGLSFAYGFVQGSHKPTTSIGYSALLQLASLYPNTPFVLPATRQTAYVSHLSNGKVHLDILYKLAEGWVVFDRDFKVKSSVHSILLGRPAFVVESRFSSHMDFEGEQVAYSFDQFGLDTQKVWTAFLSTSNTSDQAGGLPKPNYVRMASPVELEQVATHLKEGSK